MNFCIKLHCHQKSPAAVYKLGFCMCIQIQAQPVMVNTTLDHVFALALCLIVGVFVLTVGFFFLIVLISSDVYRNLQSISVPFQL